MPTDPLPNSTDSDCERRLFDEALDFPAGPARDAWLAGACRGDEALQSRILALLHAHEEESQFLPTVIIPPSERPSEEEGEMIGPYKLLQEIGQGGFGSVWMAQQSKPISRKVALKVIKMGMDTREVIARFEAERQALAMMDHPNIAKVLDAGATDRGRPFFVMELVKGIPITDYCDQAGLGTKERLALFRDVCAAINHAHQKGIIHRDIKPSNVMVTLHGDKPVVKVIDFGIAKATQGKLTDQTLFTRFEQFIGTPVYMSPEQASLSGLDIDTRSDIYALGILLYELLVGKPPFDAKSLVSAGYEEMRRIIREVEPVKPSSRLGTIVGEERTLLAKVRHIDETKLNKLVEPDLDWIVMKAIDKDRARRYETANAFAQDIVRFLADEPVTATPPSAGYQFRKFARRHKAAFRLAAGIALLLVAATLVSGWQAVRATKAEALAKDRLVESEKARADAEAISNFLTGMFESSRPGEEKGGRDVKVADVLDIAAKKLDTELADQPERRAKLQAALGSTYHSLGLLPQAITLHEQARVYYLKTLGSEHPDTLGALRRLAWSSYVAGRRDEALRMLEDVLRLSRKVSGPEHPFTLGTMRLLAHSYSVADRKDEALNLREEVLALSRKVLGPEHPATLQAMGDLARSYGSAGRKEDALKLHEEALALSRKLLGPEHPDTIGAMGASAASYADNDRKNEALKLREEALALRRKVSGPEHPFTLGAMRFLGHSYGVAGRKDEALNLREEVLALYRKVLGPEHPDTLQAMGDLARSYGSAGRKEDALKLREEALALSRKLLGPEHPDTIGAMEELARDYGSTRRKEDSLKVFKELLAVRRKANGPDHPYTFAVMADVARCYIELGREGEGFELGNEIIAICRDKEIAAGPGIAWSFNLLGIQYHKARRFDGAITLRETVAAMARKIDGPASGFAFDMMNKLAESYDAAGRRDEAAKLRAEVEALKAKK